MTSRSTNSNKGFIELMRNGLWFYFSHNNHEFAAHASSVSGCETIYVDDSKIAEKTSWRFISGHEFVLDGHHYRIEFNLKSFWSGQLVCNFYVDQVLFESSQIAMSDGQTKLSWRSILVLFVIGMIFGYLGAYIAVNML
jgi:hypothetical protein